MTTVQARDRRAMIEELQRELVPFLDAGEIDRLLARVAADGALVDVADAAEGRFAAVATLNACLFDHPAFLDALAPRDRWPGTPARPRTLRITQRIRFDGRALPERSVLAVTLPAPRTIAGVQHVRLVSACPDRLADHVLLRAGLLFAAPIAVESGRALPEIELVYEIEQTGAPYRCGVVGASPRAAAPEAAAWASVRAPAARGHELVDAFLDAFEDELQIALTGRMATPAGTLLAAGAGDPAMHAALLVDALASRGVVARVGAAQRLYLDDAGTSRLVIPRSIGFEHPFVEWRDPDAGEDGVVDLSYLGRWGHIATEANTRDEALPGRLEDAAAGREHLRTHLDPQVVIGGVAGPSRVRVLASGATHAMPAPIDRIELDVDVLEARR